MIKKQEMIKAAYDELMKATGIKFNMDDFEKWINRKANSLCRRDKKRTKGIFNLTPMQYVEGICNAIKESPVFDFYTGDKLDWTQIGKYTNEEAQELGPDIKKKYAMMPTVDHADAKPEPNFRICTWRTNDAKNDLTLDEFRKLCLKVLRHSGEDIQRK